MIRTAGALFNPKEENIYFLATSVDQIDRSAIPVHEYALVAINELSQSNADLDLLKCWLDNGNKMFIDSGIFNLTNEHKRKHGISMDHALSLAPSEIDGFDALLDKYISINRSLGDSSWGYIELDQGGRENKIKTRSYLESIGLRPIPVYHPLNDGWDYFDYLAERYDRICFANVVQADTVTRKRLIATAWDRRRKYPDLWIHLLGYTPNQFLYAMPINSGDSSSWISVVRWSGLSSRASGKPFSDMSPHYKAVLKTKAKEIGMDEATRDGLYFKSLMSSAYAAHMNMLNWRNYIARMSAIGFDAYPALDKVDELRFNAKSLAQRTLQND